MIHEVQLEEWSVLFWACSIQICVGAQKFLRVGWSVQSEMLARGAHLWTNYGGLWTWYGRVGPPEDQLFQKCCLPARFKPYLTLYWESCSPPSPPASTGNNSHFSLEASIQPTNCPKLLQKKPAVGPFSRDTGHSTGVGMCLSLPSVGNKGAPVHSDWVSIWRRPGPPQHSSAGPGCPAHPALEFWRHPHYCLEYPLVCIGASAE